MAKAHESGIQALLRMCRVGSLATLGENGPEASLAPYAIDQGNIILHLSSLARHTGNITGHPEAGFMICMPETAADSLLALPRLSLQGTIAPVSDHEYETLKLIYLRSIPDAEPLFEFADFRLFRLTPSSIYWVGGFGSARIISLNDWVRLLAHCEEDGS